MYFLFILSFFYYSFLNVKKSLIKKTKKYFTIGNTVLLLSLNSVITFNVYASLELKTDHPLISRYQGATDFRNDVFDYAQTIIPVGIIDDRYQTTNTLEVEGRISYIRYRLPKAASQFSAIKAFKQQIKQSGFNVLFECQHDEDNKINTCGKEMGYFTGLDKVKGYFQYYCGGNESFLLSAKLTRAKNKNSYLYFCVNNDGEVNQTIIDEKEFNANKIKINSKNYHPDEKSLSGIAKQSEEEKEGAKDHPLISRYPNSVITDYAAIDYDLAEFPIKAFGYNDFDQVRANKKAYFISTAGKGSYIEYRLPNGLSLYQVFQNYIQALKANNIEILFQCVGDAENECNDGTHYVAAARDIMSSLSTSGSCSDDSDAIITARKQIAVNQYVYFGFCIDVTSYRVTVEQLIVEEKPLKTGLVAVNNNYAINNKTLNGIKAQAKQDKQGTHDHPLISRFPHSVITEQISIDFGKARLPIKPLTDRNNISDKNQLSVAGKGQNTQYKAPIGASLYQVMQNYLYALKANNIEILFKCNGEKSCGKGYYNHIDANDIMPAISAYNDCNDTPYAMITAKAVISTDQNAYLFYCFSGITGSYALNISQTIIEEKPLKTGLITMSANELEKAIASKGKVAIYGILFNSDSATIQQQSTPVIKQVAELLKQKPQLKLYVVGHTDGQGSEQYNKDLSTKRAQAVINALVTNFGIAENRLQARGVGELVPVATNRAKEGRQLNRRVELVEM